MRVFATMTRNVIVVPPQLPLEAAWQVMQEHRIRHLPVVQGGALLGILSDRDVLVRATLTEAGQVVVPRSQVALAMTPSPAVCETSSTVSEVVRVMTEPKDISIGKLFGDITITGTLRNPDVSALNAKTVIQAGLSILLSALSGPLSALPFIETGGGPDAPCATLIAESRAAGQSQDPSLKKRVPSAVAGKTSEAGQQKKPATKAGKKS